MNNYDYPAGADDSFAPWNEQPVEDEEIDVIVWQTMSCVDRITINPCDDDLYSAWEKQCYTIPYLLNKLQEYLEKELESLEPKSRRAKYLKKLIMACEDWEETDVDIEKNE